MNNERYHQGASRIRLRNAIDHATGRINARGQLTPKQEAGFSMLCAFTGMDEMLNRLADAHAHRFSHEFDVPEFIATQRRLINEQRVKAGLKPRDYK